MAYYSLPLWNCVLRKVILCLPWRHNGGAEVQLHSFLTLATKWRRVVNSMPWPLYPKEESPYPLNKRLGGPTSCPDRSGQVRSKRKIACLYWGPKPISCIVTFSQTTQWTMTSNQHTLHSPVCIMVLYTVCCYANSPRWYMELFSIESVCLVHYISNCLYL